MSTAANPEAAKTPDAQPAPSGGGAPAPQTQPAAGVDPEKFSALEKQNAKLQKELAAAQKAREEDAAVLGKLKSVFSPETKDPAAEFNAVKQSAETHRAEALRLKAEKVISRVARQFDAHDEEDHFEGAIRAGVMKDDGTVDADAVKAYLEQQKATKPYLFKQPAPAPAPAEKGPPLPGSKPPSTPQPQSNPPPPPVDGWAQWTKTTH